MVLLLLSVRLLFSLFFSRATDTQGMGGVDVDVGASTKKVKKKDKEKKANNNKRRTCEQLT